MSDSLKRIMFLLVLAISTLTGMAQTLSKMSGVASYYADKFHGRRTSSGEVYDKDGYTCAHRKLPFGTRIRVTNKRNDKSVIVKVTDRGPFSSRLSIDLSRAAATDIGLIDTGIAKVDMEVLPDESEVVLASLDSISYPVIVPDFMEMFSLEQHEQRFLNSIVPLPFGVELMGGQKKEKQKNEISIQN
jgi:rare lipoprotein A (peptidoglycan hydrolase)